MITDVDRPKTYIFMSELDEQEIERIRKEYHRIDKSFLTGRYSYFNTAYLFILQERERRILSCLKKNGISDLSSKKILDVGCGTGDQLNKFATYGAKPVNLFGIDLMDQRIELAIEKFPNFNFTTGSADNLPHADQQFDIVIQVTCFSSILKIDLKQKIAGEMLRVLKNKGIIIWYDLRPHILLDRFFRPLLHVLRRNIKENGSVPTLAIGKDEIERLFPATKIEYERTGIFFRLATFSRYSWALSNILTKIPWFSTHYLAVIRLHDR